MKSSFRLLMGGILLGALAQSSAYAASFTIQLPPLPFPPKIISVIDSVPQKTKPTAVTVRAKGQKQRRLDLGPTPPTNFCDETVNPNPPLVTQGRIWYTLSTDEQRANWTSVDMTVVGTPVDPSGCDHDPVETELTGVIPAAALDAAVEGDKLFYYVQVIDTSGNKASYTPDAAAGNLPEGNVDLQTAPNLAAKPAKAGDTMLIMDVAGDVKGNIGQAVSVPSVDILGANVAIGTEHIMVNIKLQGKPENDGGVIEGYVGAFIKGDAVDDDPNDALYPDGTYALSTAFQGVLPDLVHAVWDGRCLTNVAITGGSTDALLGCTTYAGGAGTGMLEKDGQGYINWRLEHSAQGVSLIGSDGGVEIVLATGQIDIAAPEGTSPFWVTDYTNGVTYYKKTIEKNIETSAFPPPPCGGMSVEKISTATDTCKVKWNNDSTMTGGGYLIFKSTKKDGGGGSGPDITPLNGTSPVAQGTAGAANSYDDTGLTQDGKVYHYWCMPRDADGRMWYPNGNNTIKALCTKSGDCDNFAGGSWPTQAPVSCQTTDTVAPVDPVDLAASTPDGQSLKIEVTWKPGALAQDPSMTGSGAGFVIEKDGIPVGTKPFVVGVQTFSFLDVNCTTKGETFEYKIKSKDVGANTSPGVTVTGTCADKEPPGLVKNLSVVNQTSQGDPAGKVKLTWEPLDLDDERNDDFKEYVVYRCASETDDKGECTDGLLPKDKSNYTLISCPNMDVRGTESAPPSCVDQNGLGIDKYYHYVVTAKDQEATANESAFPSSTYAETAYPYRWFRVRTKPIVDTFPPDKPRDLVATDTTKGGVCELSFKMPLKNAASPPDDKFCKDGGTQGYCSGEDADVIPQEVFEYVVIAAASPATPSDKSSPRCGTGTNPGTLNDPDALIPVTCTGLENGTAYNINVFAIDSKSPPNEGDFAVAAATCTPTDEEPPAAPENGKIMAIRADEDFAIGWKAGEAVEQGGGFKVYSCANTSGDCTTFTKVHTEPLVDTSFCTVGDYADLTGSDFCYLHEPEEPAGKTFYYKVTSVDAAGNESLQISFSTLVGDLSIGPATVQSCITEDLDGSDKVDCFWTTYPSPGDIDSLVLAACKTDWDGVATLPTPSCGSGTNWVDVNANIDKTVSTISVAAGTLDQGCYQFAVLAKKDAAKSNVLSAPKFPGTDPATCIGVKKKEAEVPTCTENCVNIGVDKIGTPPAANPNPTPILHIVNSSSGASCIEGENPGFGGEGQVTVNPSSCGEKVKIKACDIPTGWLRNKNDNNCIVCKEVNVADVVNKEIATACKLYTPDAGGDTNGDGKVNISDFGKFKSEFNKDPDKADFNDDGRVNLTDFGILKGNFNLDAN